MNDQRIYKKSILSIQENTIEEKEDYYLMDGFGKTVAILHRKDDSQGLTESWEYYASGAERECRLVPTSSQAPSGNSGNSNVKFKKDQVSFFLYDHLGNTRVTYTPTSFISHPGDPTVAVNKVNTVIDYFPYGKVLREFQNGDQERYLTTQHERDAETGLDYRGARFYDSDVGRFLSLDPLATKYPSHSAYCYVLGNPIVFTDPDGKSVNTDFVNVDTGEYKHVDDGKDEVALVQGANWSWVSSYSEVVESGEMDYASEEYFENNIDAEVYEGGVIIQRRTSEGNDWTISELQAVGNGQSVEGYVLEPGGPSTTTANQDKRIPEGVYNIGDWSSKKYPDNFVLYNGDVSKSRAILYHKGNYPSNTSGCNMPGSSKGDGAVYGSTKKMEELRQFINSIGAENVKTVITLNIDQ